MLASRSLSPSATHSLRSLNTYALRAVIEEKKKGLPVRPSADVEHDETVVVDLMEALKRSLGTAAPRAPAAKPRAANRNRPGGGRKRVA
jgi:DNA end-binding protein Ku